MSPPIFVGVDGSTGVHDHPATALIARCEDADRVVVGPRGLGGFPAMLLAAVTQQLVQHARCPVAVIPPHV